jgi:hypothetical protein
MSRKFTYWHTLASQARLIYVNLAKAMTPSPIKAAHVIYCIRKKGFNKTLSI